MTRPVSADRVVAIDVGTQSVRALVVDPDGTHRRGGARARSRRTCRRTPAGRSRIPSSTGRSIGEACRRVLADPAVQPRRLAGVTLTTQRGTVVVTDADGTPLRPAIVWLDDRRTSGLPPFGRRDGDHGLGFRILGLRDTIETFAADCEANWLRDNEPETWARIRHYLFLSGFLTPPADRSLRRLHRRPGRLPAVRLQGVPLGRAWRLAVDDRAGRPGLAARARAADRAARRDHARGRGGHGAPRRACR